MKFKINRLAVIGLTTSLLILPCSVKAASINDQTFGIIGASVWQEPVSTDGHLEKYSDLPGDSDFSIATRKAAPIAAALKPETPLSFRGSAGAALYKSISPGVVLLITKSGLGSGSVIKKSGLILTNWHVVKGYDSVAIIFKPPLGAKLKPTDVYRGVVKRVDALTDLALVEITNPPKNMTILKIGKLKDVEIGGDAHAIGHPTGESWTYTRGIISQVRSGYVWKTSSKVKHKATVIQTQTPINPGNSGGPLLSDNGKIIGVNTFVKSTAQGINFAVSTNEVFEFLKSKTSRYAVPISTRKQKCKAVSDKRDTNGNGRMDVKRIDTNCDRKPDIFIFDKDENGRDDLILIDSDFDGKIDTKVVPSKKNGRLDVWLYDKNGDGKPDLIGVDKDNDGKPDKYRVIKRG
jgi:S1-C subfamily serine protease